MKPLRVTDKSNLTLYDETRPIVLERCHNVRIWHPVITRNTCGPYKTGIYCLECTGVTIYYPRIIDPVRHGIQFDQCSKCRIVSGMIMSRRRREDGVNFHKSRHCSIEGATILGPTRASGTGICIDVGCQAITVAACAISGVEEGWFVDSPQLVLGPPRVGVTIADGKKHVLRCNNIEAASTGIQVSDEWYGEAKIGAINLTENTVNAPIPVYVRPGLEGKVRIE